MSTLKHKHSWTKRPRSPFPEVTSPLPPSSTNASPTETKASIKAKEAAQKGETLLKTAVRLVRDADELFSQGVPSSDPRIQAMRHQIENDMPAVYEYAHDCTASHNSALTNLYLRSIEAFLNKASDNAKNGVLKPHNSPPRKEHSPPAAARVSPKSSSHSPSTYSPPRVSLPKPVPPVVQPPQRPQQPQQQAVAPALPNRYPQDSPSISNPSLLPSQLFPPMHTPNPLLHNPASGMQSFPMQHHVPSTSHPLPVTPSPSAVVQPGSYPGTRRSSALGTSRPPLQSPCYEASYTSGHLYDAAEHTTRHQKMVFCAVHDLLQKRSSRHTRQPWYEPPIGLSPDELINGQEPRVAPMFHHHHHHPALSGQFQQYFRPPHSSPSPTGYPYHFHGNRSVAVGTCLPRSASME